MPLAPFGPAIIWLPGTIWTGDNLAILRGVNDACVDLIYLDPPFNSNRHYEAPIGSKAAGASFKDAWTLDDVDVHEHGELADRNPAAHAVIDAARQAHGKGMQSYMIFMAVRLLELHRVLKPTGALWLHCDPTASHYLKNLLDAVFGHGNFLNEVIWAYRTGGVSKRWFGRKHDVLLYYAAKHGKHTFHVEKERSYNRNNKPYRFKGVEEFEDDNGCWYTMAALRDVWELNAIGRSSKERTGYPTQKPLALLERVIRASSNPGDLVLDPFCGCATTLVAADRLQRDWVGIDLSPTAVRLVHDRIGQDRGIWGGPNALDTPPRRTDLGNLPNYRTHRHRLYGVQEGICGGGTDHPENLQLLCSACNRSKGGRTMAEWRAAQ
ncbi:MAG: HNH endonuclease [Rhodobacteraceae bacterium]|nr:HNH endonuclease [Paracoccaceae bacterium]